MRIPPTGILAILAVLAACCTSCLLYSRGSFRELGTPFIGKRVSLPCIDLAVAKTEDTSAKGQVIAYSFGNRCFHAAQVDLSAIRAVAEYPNGTTVLQAFDPHHELRSMQLDALWMGSEEIEYIADNGSAPSAVCVDVGRVEPDPAATERWLCFGGDK